MNICRQTHVDLNLFNEQGQKIHDLCSLVVGIRGKIDPHSGMIINLVDIDQGLNAFKDKFSSSEIPDLQKFFLVARNFLTDIYSPFSSSLDLLQLKTSWGLVQWKTPWEKQDFTLIQHHRILVEKSPKHFEVYKVFTEYQGAIQLFRRLKPRDLKRLWQAQSSLEQVKCEMTRFNHLSAFGVQDFLGRYQRWFRSGL